MPGERLPVGLAVVCMLSVALVFQLADAEVAGGDDAEPTQVVITGTRVQNRSALETAVPIDVLTSDVFRNRGVPEISQALSEALPSFNYPRPGLSDASDTVRPATLRGLTRLPESSTCVCARIAMEAMRRPAMACATPAAFSTAV